MIFITGDTHGSYSHIVRFCESLEHVGANDVMIILGDTGLNYFGDDKDTKKKRKVLQKIPMTLFCIHGNHDRRPQNIASYHEKKFMDGTVFFEKEFPRLLFAKDGEIFNFDNRKTLAIGGAYSIDKDYRLKKGYHWFEDEQPSRHIKERTERVLENNDWNIDTVLSHTCPLKFEPIEAFFESVNQNTVDKSTEKWLDKIENKLTYHKWYCGHFHIDKSIERIRFVYKDILLF